MCPFFPGEWIRHLEILGRHYVLGKCYLGCCYQLPCYQMNNQWIHKDVDEFKAFPGMQNSAMHSLIPTSCNVVFNLIKQSLNVYRYLCSLVFLNLMDFILWDELFCKETQVLGIIICGERLSFLISNFDNVKVSRNFIGWFINLSPLHHSIKAALSNEEYQRQSVLDRTMIGIW